MLLGHYAVPPQVPLRFGHIKMAHTKGVRGCQREMVFAREPRLTRTASPSRLRRWYLSKVRDWQKGDNAWMLGESWEPWRHPYSSLASDEHRPIRSSRLVKPAIAFAFSSR